MPTFTKICLQITDAFEVYDIENGYIAICDFVQLIDDYQLAELIPLSTQLVLREQLIILQNLLDIGDYKSIKSMFLHDFDDIVAQCHDFH